MDGHDHAHAGRRLSGSERENLDTVAAFQQEEADSTSEVQLAIEKISGFFGSPGYLAFAVVFIAAWIVFNTWGPRVGWPQLDEPPFIWLQGIVSAHALLLTIAVLIRQNRMALLAEHRAHLDLQINLLTEQKVSRLLKLLNDGSSASPAENAELEELARPVDPQALLSEIKRGVSGVASP